MTMRKVGDKTLIECETLEEAIAYAETKLLYQELWARIYAAEAIGLLSAN